MDESWELVRNCDGKTIRLFPSYEDAWWYVNHDGLYREPEYSLRRAA